MKQFVLLGALGVFVISGCAQVDAGISAADQATDQATDTLDRADDLKMKVWLNSSCRQTIGAVRRADMGPAFRKALLERCLGEAAPDE